MLKSILFFAFFVVSTLTFRSTAFAFDTQAQAAYIIDQTTGTVLLAKNEDFPLPPASMSKLMTLFMTFEAIRDGRLLWDDKLPVSEHAMSYRGSSMFLDTTDRVTVRDLIRGIIVLSGNDACVVVAEALSPDGTETGFANMMTSRAKKLGMTNSIFANSNGWPSPQHRMSMKDLAILANRIVEEFPSEYTLFSEKEFLFDGRTPSNVRNRNPLLKLDIGADGLKTGYTREAGYGMVGSAKRNNRRVTFVLTGLKSSKARAIEAEKIVNWSFRHFTSKTIEKSNQPIAELEVWRGNNQTVGVALESDTTFLVKSTETESISSKIVYQGPIEAPINIGDPIAKLIISVPGMAPKKMQLVATEAVSQGGFVSRLRTAALVLLRKVKKGRLGG